MKMDPWMLVASFLLLAGVEALAVPWDSSNSVPSSSAVLANETDSTETGPSLSASTLVLPRTTPGGLADTLQTEGQTYITYVTSKVTISEDPPYLSATFSTSLNTVVTQNNTVHLAGIGIGFCPIWSCQNRCFQKTNDIPAAESSPAGKENGTSSSNQSQTVHTKCSCDDSCVRLGDCCIDFFSLCLNITDEAEVIQVLEHALYDDPTASSTEDQFDLNVTHMILSFGSCVTTPEGERYTMISSCPSASADQGAVATCAEAQKHPNLQPYSDVDDVSLTFRNKECARCHSYNESRLLPWQQGLSCQNVGAGLGSSADRAPPADRASSEQESYLNDIVAAMQSGNCTYIYRPPGNTRTQPRPCLPPSSTLKPDDPTAGANASSTDGACTFEDMLLCKAYSYQTFTSDDQEVKNPHCLKCMTGSSPVSVDLPCSRADNKSSGGTSPSVGILALFSRDSSGTNSITVNGHTIPTSGIVCKDDQVFDYVFLICRTLFCPVGYHPVNGQCSLVGHYTVPANSQMRPEGTQKIYVDFELKASVWCDNQQLEGAVIAAFQDAYGRLAAPVTHFLCEPNPSGNHSTELTSPRVSVQITVNPLSALVKVLSSLKGMLRALSFVTGFMVTNYDTEPNVDCATGDPNLVDHANVTEKDGDLFVKRMAGSSTLFYPLTNTIFKLDLRKSNSTDSAVRAVYISMLCVQPHINSSLNCSSVAFDIRRTRVQNGTLYITNTDLSFPQSHYEFHELFVLVCSDFQNLNNVRFFSFTDVQYYLSWACSLTSVVCLMTSLVAFALLPYLRTLAGHMTASLAGSLALGQLLILVDFINHRVVCSVLAAVCHFFWLAAFSWMTALAVHMTYTFFGSMATKTGKPNANEVRKEYGKYSMGGWGVPAVLVVSLVVLDSLEDSPLKVGYGTPLCGWMSQSYVFLVPVAVALALNVVCFLLTLISIERTMRASRSALSHQQTGERQRLMVYIKMMSAMGFTWAAGFLASFSQVAAFWWLYIVLNGLQGTFVAFSFVLNSRLLRVLKSRWTGRKGDTGTAGRTSGTGKELQQSRATCSKAVSGGSRGVQGGGQGLSCLSSHPSGQTLSATCRSVLGDDSENGAGASVSLVTTDSELGKSDPRI